MIRLAIIDDQTLVRSGITQLLGTVDGIEVVGEAADAVTAVRVIEGNRQESGLERPVQVGRARPGAGGAEGH
jgi:DNA-binding NarL/FixJ family response regulator